MHNAFDGCMVIGKDGRCGGWARRRVRLGWLVGRSHETPSAALWAARLHLLPALLSKRNGHLGGDQKRIA